MEKICSSCKETKHIDLFAKNKSTNKSGVTATCKVCKNEKQKLYRKLTNNVPTKIYEKTKKGFLMRVYRNMQSRIEGIQKEKHHLYKGKELLPRDEFYEWANNQIEFHRLFKEYEESNYEIRIAPTVDRKDSSKGYSIDNMEFVPQWINSQRGSISRHYGN